MQTLKLMTTSELNNLYATIIDITEAIHTNTEKEGVNLFTGVTTYVIALLRKHNYSISVAKALINMSGVNMKALERIYNNDVVYEHYIEQGLGKLLTSKNNPYNLNYTNALMFQYELEKLFNNDYWCKKELENITALQQVEQILIV